MSGYWETYKSDIKDGVFKAGVSGLSATGLMAAEYGFSSAMRGAECFAISLGMAALFSLIWKGIKNLLDQKGWGESKKIKEATANGLMDGGRLLLWDIPGVLSALLVCWVLSYRFHMSTSMMFLNVIVISGLAGIYATYWDVDKLISRHPSHHEGLENCIDARFRGEAYAIR